MCGQKPPHRLVTKAAEGGRAAKSFQGEYL